MNVSFGQVEKARENGVVDIFLLMHRYLNRVNHVPFSKLMIESITISAIVARINFKPHKRSDNESTTRPDASRNNFV